uniref:Uncharacterized protein MANES_11G071900 n=1 Tax=Rhizophora mucronata TaxID=61149 RepID=A0A2P2L0X9_RHIMU
MEGEGSLLCVLLAFGWRNDITMSGRLQSLPHSSSSILLLVGPMFQG